MLTIEGCRDRQWRLLQVMHHLGLSAAVLSRAKTITYFTGALPDPTWPHVLVLPDTGEATLITNLEPKHRIAAAVRTYTGYSIHKLIGREIGHEEMAGLARDLLPHAAVGVESEWISGGLIAMMEGKVVNLTPEIIRLRRTKLPDEIDCIRATARITEAGYAAIRKHLAPGMTELDAYLVIHRAMTEAAGTSLDLNGDFACGVRAIGGGGPPTTRVIERGDLCIFDLFPSFEGYMCDLCRTFVAGPATDDQYAAWEHVAAAHWIAIDYIRPGASTRAVWAELRAFLDRHPGTQGSFTHHAGHGVGMDGWEQPWLNAGSEQFFLEGEVIACEPGLYSPALQGGIRLEHNYLVTAGEPVALDSFPMEL
jgi:Xaa-Pro aminopeptidase